MISYTLLVVFCLVVATACGLLRDQTEAVKLYLATLPYMI